MCFYVFFCGRTFYHNHTNFCRVLPLHIPHALGFVFKYSKINHLQLLTFIDYTKPRVKTGIGKEFIGSNNSVSLTFQSLTFYVSDCTFNSSRWAYIYKFKLEVQRTIQNNWRIFASRLKLYVGCILAEENFLNMDMYFVFIVHEVLNNE